MYEIIKPGITYMHVTKIVVQNKDNIQEILNWLKQYCVGPYTWRQGYIFNERVVSFEQESDLLNFSLYWV